MCEINETISFGRQDQIINGRFVNKTLKYRHSILRTIENKSQYICEKQTTSFSHSIFFFFFIPYPDNSKH